MSNFGKLETCLADIKLWGNDLKAAGPNISLPAELIGNLVPMLKSMVDSTMQELAEHSIIIEEQGKIIDELVDQEEDFLQEEMSEALTKTLELGLIICGILAQEGVVLANDLANQKLQTSIKTYQQNTMMLIDRISEITIEEEEEEEEEDATEGTPVHGEGGDVEELESGGDPSSQLGAIGKPGGLGGDPGVATPEGEA